VFLIYFATQVSAVYDSLKSLLLSFTKDKLEERMIQITRLNENVTFNLTDSTGPDKDLRYHADVLIKVGTEEYL